MATIEKYSGKDGLTYRISVYAFFDTQGKRIRHRMSYKPTLRNKEDINGID